MWGTVQLSEGDLRFRLPAGHSRGQRRRHVSYPRALTDLYLNVDARAGARMFEPSAEAPRSAKRIALRARRKQTRELGNL